MNYSFGFFGYFDLCFSSHSLICRNSLFIMDTIMYVWIMDCGFIYYGFDMRCKYVSPNFSCILKLCNVFSTCLLACVSLKVMLLIDIELAYMNTNHEDFIGFAK